MKFSEAEVLEVLRFLGTKAYGDPEKLDGRCFFLVREGFHSIRNNSAQHLAGMLKELARDYPSGPKGAWVRIEVGRQLVSVCGDAVGAEVVLTEALDELKKLADWGEHVRARLIRDADIWITTTTRPRAGSREDALGQAYLLRGFARVERVEMVGALADLSDARPLLTKTENEHRLVNIDHNLASVWLQLGDHERAIETAQRAARRYETPSWTGWTGLPEPIEWNGINAMRRVEARARLARGGKDDVLEARRLLGEIVSDNMLQWLPETYCDAVLLLMESWLIEPCTAAERERCWQRIAPAIGRLERRDETLRARCSLLRGRLAMARGELNEAEQLLTETAERAKELRHPALALEVLVAQGGCRLKAGHPDDALASYERAAEEMVALVVGQQLWLMPTAMAAFQQRFDELLDGAFRAWEQLRATDSGPEHLARCYALAQRFHGFESWCWLLMASPRLETEAVVNLRAEQRRLYSDYEQLLREPAGSPRGQLKLKKARDTLLAKLDSVQSRLAAANNVAPAMEGADFDLASVQACLAPGELLIECVDLPRQALAFVLSHDAVDILPLPLGSGWRDALGDLARWADSRDEMPLVTDVPALVELATQLLGDPEQPSGRTWLGERLAAGDVETLLWSPAGVFSRVPLAALPFRGRALGRDVAIVNVRSGSLLAWQRSVAHHEPGEPRLLALGNPSYPEQQVARLVQRSLVAGRDLSPLPGTAREVLELGKLFASPAELERLDAIDTPAAFSGELNGERYRLLLGDSANKRALTAAALADATVLHFACHGHVVAEAPSLSALALTIDTESVAGDPSGGLLHLDELVQLRGDYELVALSACESDRGAVRSHASETSLAWAAQLAGAKRVLATRWKISDEQASRLVPGFYRRWLAGEPPAVALRNLITEIDGSMPVREWAALTMWGEPR
ncbi:MAG: CHAT domain-containing protein [Planctomycetota bacterium]